MRGGGPLLDSFDYAGFTIQPFMLHFTSNEWVECKWLEFPDYVIHEQGSLDLLATKINTQIGRIFCFCFNQSETNQF